MTKKIKSTYDKFIESMTPQQKKKFEEEYREFALSELILALMERDEISARKRAKMAGVSPTIVQEIRFGLKKNCSSESLLFKALKKGFEEAIAHDQGKLDLLNTRKHK